MLWLNATDGLNGLSCHRKPGASGGWLNRLVVEYLITKDQSGTAFDYYAAYQGEDNYFNHGQYIQGWSYLGHTIGTPFIMPGSDVSVRAQGRLFFPNNRLKMGYVGMAGRVSHDLNWVLRLSYSQNYGTYAGPYSPLWASFRGW